MRAAIVGVEVAELGRAQLHVVDLVAQQPLLVIGCPELLGHVAAGLGRDLHQAHGARARYRSRVEGALLAGDGVDHGRLDRRSDRLIVGNADGRKGDNVRAAVRARAPTCPSSTMARASLVTGGDLADRREPDGVARAFAEIGQRARDQIAFVDRVEQFDRARDLEPGAIRRGFRRRAQHDVLEAEPRTRDLAVIGGGVPCGRLVVRARLVSAAPAPPPRDPASSRRARA